MVHYYKKNSPDFNSLILELKELQKQAINMDALNNLQGTFRCLIKSLKSLQDLVPADQIDNFVANLRLLNNEKLNSECSDMCRCEKNKVGKYSCDNCGSVCKQCAKYIQQFSHCRLCRNQSNPMPISENFKCRMCMSKFNSQSVYPLSCGCVYCMNCMERIAFQNYLGGLCLCNEYIQDPEKQYYVEIIQRFRTS